MSKTTKTNLKWRLTKLPTTDELLKLVEAKIITNEEAKDVLFSEETKEEVEIAELKKEITFLKEVVERLSRNNQTKIIEVIREVEVPWRKYRFTEPYYNWADNNGHIYKTTCNASGSEQIKSLVSAAFNQIH